MFEDCKTIKKAPILSAKELVEGCYSNIFNGCCSLNQIIMLATDVSANECLDNWINGISAKGQLIKHPLLINDLGNEYESLKEWEIDGFEKEEIDYSNEYFTIHNIGV